MAGGRIGILSRQFCRCPRPPNPAGFGTATGLWSTSGYNGARLQPTISFVKTSWMPFSNSNANCNIDSYGRPDSLAYTDEENLLQLRQQPLLRLPLRLRPLLRQRPRRRRRRRQRRHARRVITMSPRRRPVTPSYPAPQIREAVATITPRQYNTPIAGERLWADLQQCERRLQWQLRPYR